jgi:hypothetical protein
MVVQCSAARSFNRLLIVHKRSLRCLISAEGLLGTWLHRFCKVMRQCSMRIFAPLLSFV